MNITEEDKKQMERLQQSKEQRERKEDPPVPILNGFIRPKKPI